jgi:hypothetical protein
MKKLFYLAVSLFILLNAHAQSPTCMWVKKSYDPSPGSSTANIVVDNEHNVFMINNNGDLSLIDSSLSPNTFLSGSCIVKYDSLGHLLWYRKVKGDTSSWNGNVHIWAVQTDNANNVYAYGYYYSNILIENQTLTSAGGSDIVLIKYDKNGNLLWAKSIGGPLSERIAYDGFRVSKNGDIFCTGLYGFYNYLSQYPTNDTIVTHFDTLSITTTDSVYYYAFIARFNSNGTIRWVKSIPSGSIKVGVLKPGLDIEFLSIDKNNNSYLSGIADTGVFLDGIQLQSNPEPLVSNNSTNNFFLKCDSNGQALFSKSIFNKGYDILNYIAADSQENAYLFQYSATDTTFIDGVPHVVNGCYLIKYDNVGNLVWLKKYGDIIHNQGISLRGQGIVIDKDNNLILAFTPGLKNIVVDSDTIHLPFAIGIFLIKANSTTGKAIWTKAICDSGIIYSCFVKPDDNNNFYITGLHNASSFFCIDSQCIQGYTFDRYFFLAKFHQTPTAIEPIPFYNNTLTLFPNPANETVTINRGNILPSQLRLIDALGRTLPITLTTEENRTHINIATLPPGLYMVLLNDGNNVLTAKLMKE